MVGPASRMTGLVTHQPRHDVEVISRRKEPETTVCPALIPTARMCRTTGWHFWSAVNCSMLRMVRSLSCITLSIAAQTTLSCRSPCLHHAAVLSTPAAIFLKIFSMCPLAIVAMLLSFTLSGSISFSTSVMASDAAARSASVAPPSWTT
eukprot:SAG22_NODE_1960_length_3248_cov_2.405208_2_plen_149_part_00